MARATDASVAAEDSKLVSVRLVRNYVPKDADFYILGTDPYKGDPDRETKLYIKRLAGEVLDIPREEARNVIAAGIAVIDADLV